MIRIKKFTQNIDVDILDFDASQSKDKLKFTKRMTRVKEKILARIPSQVKMPFTPSNSKNNRRQTSESLRKAAQPPPNENSSGTNLVKEEAKKTFVRFRN